MGSRVVGLQHYNGVVSDRENVVLRRQPDNTYDSNAIQVLNIRNEQIGHVPREMAAVLAPVMDRLARSQAGGTDLRVEGHIPRGSGNVFSMPLRVSLYGHDPAGALAPQMLDLGKRLQRTYCSAARGSVDVLTSPDAEGTVVSEIDDATMSRIMGGKPPKKAGPTGPSMQEVMERELEEIFSSGPGASYADMPEADTPAGLHSPLYPHQRKALHWMTQQERGLTVEEALNELGGGSAAPQEPAKRNARKASMAALPQVFFWIKEALPGGGCVYKNLSTNSAFRQPPRLPRGGILADDMGLGKTITVLALLLTDIAQGAASEAGGACRSLVVCPLSVLSNWAEQLQLHAPSLRVRQYHGSGRDRAKDSFRLHDVTLTTFDILRAEVRDQDRGVMSVAWHRAILDEAHVIKGHRTATAQAVEQLKAERRWCLTGTPIQNSIEDIFSLARFLRLEPFNRHEWFNRAILRPLKSRDMAGLERLQILLRSWCLRRTKDMKIADPQTGLPRPLLTLPEKRLEVVRVPLDPVDRALYERLFSFASLQVRELEKDSALGASFSKILALLTRLRQLCCSPKLLPEALATELRKPGGSDPARLLEVAVAALGSEKVEDLLKNLAAAQEDDCSICLLPGCNVVTRCGHVFHRACIETAIAELGRAGAGACPLCRRPVKRSELLEKPEELEVVEGEDGEGKGMAPGSAGSKVRAVVGFLEDHVLGKCDTVKSKPHKAIIFSQFTSLLSLIQAELQQKSVPLVRLDGSMTQEKRVQALQTFRDYGKVQVILCSLKAAGTGLNLTAADHVLLVDPWWNPSVEDQAMDRAHRLGQDRPVRVLRFVAERTVEERILEVHAQKRAIMEGALARKSREELRQMRLEMVSSLFQPF